jgi:hypothetical protein
MIHQAAVEASYAPVAGLDSVEGQELGSISPDNAFGIGERNLHRTLSVPCVFGFPDTAVTGPSPRMGPENGHLEARIR